MVRWFADRSGRFPERPHYEPIEIDRECESIVVRFLRDLHGRVEYPVTTDDLEKLVERRTRDLDLYADLSADGPDVEGVTRFRSASKPSVEISASLYGDERRSNRTRTTLAHELGHVVFHDALFQARMGRADLFRPAWDERVICKRDRMVDAPVADWLEWQACYASGAFLMPRTALLNLAREAPNGGSPGDALVMAVVSRFQVSRDAARVRLSKLGLMPAREAAPSLFGGPDAIA